MDILKYLDVLIGLAVVMLLLSPLVSAITQLWIWISNTRAGRLQVGLKRLIQQLGGNPYDQFYAAEVSELDPGVAVVTLAGDGFPAVTGTANAEGRIIFTDNVAGRLKAGNGLLTFEPPAAGAVVNLLARGPVGDWSITSSVTDSHGKATLKYAFPGPAQFTSWRAAVDVPPGITMTAVIASGALKGTTLAVTNETVTYPPNTRPVAPTHDLEITLSDAGGPVEGRKVTFKFARNDSFDRPHPLPGPANHITETLAEEIARAVLLHPMIAQPPFLKLEWENRMRGEVIEREELIRILLEFAAGLGTGGAGLSPEALAALRQMLSNNGIAAPGQTLADIGSVVQELEKTDPKAAAHVRVTKAILSAAHSPFVAKVNNWFDQAMDRTTAEYKFRAQIITVLGAFLVAVAVQMDSLDLLRRLATDDKLRDSLVKQAEVQQKRMDDQAKVGPQALDREQAQDEIQLAKSRREEIETNLAQLRDPAMAILPDHFIWQPLPRARLERNPAWQHPYSRRLELLVGASAYPVDPRWTDDPLADIRNAINRSGAPVATSVESHRVMVIRAPDIGKIQVKADGIDRLARDDVFAVAKLEKKPEKKVNANERVYLLAGYDAPFEITVDGKEDIEDAIRKSNAPVSVSSDNVSVTLTATKHETRWIELRTRANDQRTNLLDRTEMVGKTGHLDEAAIQNSKRCAVSDDKETRSVGCALDDIAKALGPPVEAQMKNLDSLVLTSERLGALQLRSVPGHAESDMLDRAAEYSCNLWVCFDWEMLKRSWIGVVLTWMLLSLGAPFWYDALKDMLKLRSSLASKEEAARNDRQSNTAKT